MSISAEPPASVPATPHLTAVPAQQEPASAPESAGPLPPSDADLMQNLDDAGKASVEKLRALKAGSEFDRDYIRYEIEGHRKLLDIQEVYLKSPDNLDQANVAKLARGMIKEHLVLLTEVDKAA